MPDAIYAMPTAFGGHWRLRNRMPLRDVGGSCAGTQRIICDRTVTLLSCMRRRTPDGMSQFLSTL